MTAFLGELGKKLAERWLTLLVLPGALYLAVAVAARTLGHAHPVAISRISAQITAWSHSRAAGTVAGQVMLLTGILAAAAAIGLAAQALGAGVERAVLAADWPSWPLPLRWLVSRRTAKRQKRWDAVHKMYSALYGAAATAVVPITDKARDRRLALMRTRSRIALERPQRPTWSGDRINAAAIRLKRDRSFDLPVLWPYLWLAMPETTRSQITESRQNLARAAGLGGWAVLYSALSWWWWPAAPLAAALALTARHRIRAAADAYATLLETAATLHTHALAASLGVSDDDGTSEALMKLLGFSKPPLVED